MKFRNQPIAFPEGNGLYAAGVIALVFFIADTFFFSAYTNNADAFTVSSIVLMFPAAASLMKFLWTREIPNRYHIAAYLFVAALLIVPILLFRKYTRARPADQGQQSSQDELPDDEHNTHQSQ